MFSGSRCGWSRIGRAYAAASDDSSSSGVGAPTCVRVLEEVEVLGRVHPGDELGAVLVGRTRRTELRAGDRVEDPIDPLGDLGGIDELPAIEERFPGVVRPVRVGCDDQHPEAVARAASVRE